MQINFPGQAMKEANFTGNSLVRHPLLAGINPGIQNSGFDPSSGGSDFKNIVAMALSQSNMGGSASSMSPESVRSLAQIRAMGLESGLLANLSGVESGGFNMAGLGGSANGGFNQAAALVGTSNIQAMLSADNYGNMLGLSNSGNFSTPTLDMGQTFTPEQMRAWRQSALNPRSEAATTFTRGDLKMPPSLAMPSGVVNLPEASLPPRSFVSDTALRVVTEAWAERDMVKAKARGEATEAKTAKVTLDDVVARTDQILAQIAIKAAKEEKTVAAAPVKETKVAQAEAVETESKGGKFTMEKLDRLVNKVALALGMDSSLVKAVIKTESNFNHKAVSPAGAKGLMQLMPGTASDMGVKDPFNPVENIWGGSRYLKKMLDRHDGSLNKALASYNWGPGNFDRYGKNGNMPGETRRYISLVNKYYAQFKQDQSGRA